MLNQREKQIVRLALFALEVQFNTKGKTFDKLMELLEAEEDMAGWTIEIAVDEFMGIAKREFGIELQQVSTYVKENL